MLSSLRSTFRKTNTPLAKVVSGTVAVLLSTSLIAPAIAQQQASERATRELSDSTGLHREQLSVYKGIWRDRLETEAKNALAGAEQTVQANAAKADASAAKTMMASLTGYTKLDDSQLRVSIDRTNAASAALAAAGAEADRLAEAAAANTPEGAKTTARRLAAGAYGWGDAQFQCLSDLWQKESGWNYRASNGSSGATGIPQALPGSKMAAFGSDWADNATTQIEWGLHYIERGYGTPCSAWGHSQPVGWY
ncbi:hypothetical protein ATY41_08200 [Leifsonia xyli subsp. xyli]|nr:hypothetical protein [Leifsonia xyli]ODA90884.1 hypothetical protein ATY41_08200 [Leifsonia xyli subsp. xyli]